MDQDLNKNVQQAPNQEEELNTSASQQDQAYDDLVKENQAYLNEEDLEDTEDETSTGSDEEVSFSPQEQQVLMENLRNQLQALAKQREADRQEMLLQVADAVNGRKRAEAETERVRKFAVESLVKALLPVVDALDRALEVTNKDDPALKATYEGLESTMQLFLKELGAFGVERIDPKGEVFDPNKHQAIAMAESRDVAANHILNVMQKGFLLNGRVVRPAMVIVAKAPQNQEAPKEQINIQA